MAGSVDADTSYSGVAGVDGAGVRVITVQRSEHTAISGVAAGDEALVGGAARDVGVGTPSDRVAGVSSAGVAVVAANYSLRAGVRGSVAGVDDAGIARVAHSVGVLAGTSGLDTDSVLAGNSGAHNRLGEQATVAALGGVDAHSIGADAVSAGVSGAHNWVAAAAYIRVTEVSGARIAVIADHSVVDASSDRVAGSGVAFVGWGTGPVAVEATRGAVSTSRGYTSPSVLARGGTQASSVAATKATAAGTARGAWQLLTHRGRQ